MLSKLSELRLSPWFGRTALLFVLVAVAVVLWANRYGYVQMTFPTGHSLPVRIHRPTGHTEILCPAWADTPAVWKSVDSGQDEPPKR